MTAQDNLQTPPVNEYLDLSVQQVQQFRKILNRTIQVLGKRQVQIQIDFPGMLNALSQSLERSQLSAQELARRSSQFQELVDMSALLTSSLELESVPEKVLDTVIKLTGAERAYLMLKHGDSSELTVQAARNAAQQSLSSEDITFSRGIITAAIEQKSPLVTTNAQDDERFTEMKSVFVNELRSIILVPLMLKDQVVGVLYVDNRIEQGIFSQDNIPLLSAFANQAAIAISNARLFGKVKSDLEQAQRQVQSLLLEVDRDRVEARVSEITETEYFKQLASKAEQLRSKRRGEER
jgi:phosphoserine phosphatase RsbU/P